MKMKNEEILESAINKAFPQATHISVDNSNDVEWSIYFDNVLNGSEYSAIIEHPFGLIFSHEFAKAFFGEENGDFVNEYSCGDPSCPMEFIKWKYHLQIMVISEDPIQYLKSFL